jgi:hypothetical protein
MDQSTMLGFLVITAAMYPCQHFTQRRANGRRVAGPLVCETGRTTAAAGGIEEVADPGYR